MLTQGEHDIPYIDITKECEELGELRMKETDGALLIVACFVAAFLGAIAGVVCIWKFGGN